MISFLLALLIVSPVIIVMLVHEYKMNKAHKERMRRLNFLIERIRNRD